MPYLEEICKAGKTVEINRYYSSRYNSKKTTREKPKKATREKQKEINKRNAEKKLAREMNANFIYMDWLMTLDYRFFKGDLPPDKEQMKKDIRNFLNKLRKVFKKNGKVLKYIHVMEIGKRGARHHHLVISNIDPTLITDLWAHGYMHLTPLDRTGQYRKIANYFIKYSDTHMGTEKQLQGRRWNPSQNLIHPISKKRVIWKHDFFKSEAKPRKGYYIDKESIEAGFHEETGYSFFKYTLIELEDTKNVKKLKADTIKNIKIEDKTRRMSAKLKQKPEQSKINIKQEAVHDANQHISGDNSKRTGKSKGEIRVRHRGGQRSGSGNKGRIRGNGRDSEPDSNTSSN